MRLKIILCTLQEKAVFKSLLAFIFFLFLFLLNPNQTVAQETYEQKKITLKKGLIRLDSAMAIVKKQAGVIFSFNPRRLDPRQKIYIKSTTKTLSDFINILKAETKVSVKIIENYVVIGSSSKNTTKIAVEDAPIVTVTQKKIIEQEKQEKELAVSLKKEETKRITDSLKLVAALDSAHVSDSLYQLSKDTLTQTGSDTIKSQIPSSLMPSDSIQSDTAIVNNPIKPDTTNAVKPKPKKVRKKPNPFLKVGLGIDDSSFLGAGIQIGIPIVYATLSGNTNFEASHFRYGIGTSIKLNTNIRLHIGANTGNVNREGYFTDVNGDRYPIAVESKFHRIGAGLEFRLQNKFSMQVIPQYNYLTNDYFIDNQPSSLEIFGDAGDEIFHTIKPLYVISDTFSSNTNSNVKTWIGVQVNLLYRINFKSNKGN